jgi:hypothetical protein
MIVAHITHEAVEKIGGIGTVIAGLVTSDAYQSQVSRTVLVGPRFQNEDPAHRRIGPGGRLIYSSLDAITPAEWREKFSPIEHAHDVRITYGYRPVTEACTGKTVDAEVLLVDVFRANPNRLNLFKGRLHERFEIQSDRFQHIWDFEQYVRLAEPAYEALEAIGAVDPNEDLLLLAHEYMGMPTALKAVMTGAENVRTVFHAHEVASVRPVIEQSPGHDTMFYNVLSRALDEGLSMEQVFPQINDNYKHPLVKAARYCDEVFAVGEYIQRELEFLDPHFKTMGVDLVFNGIPAERIAWDQRQASRGRMQQYAENLFGRRPTWIMTHVARPVLSKGIWRDLRVLHEMEGELARRGESAVYFMLGTLGGVRRGHDTRHMERTYGWPVNHERGYPDLTGGEEVVGETIAAFNASHRAVQAVLVNQWDWSSRACGQRMPEDMSFADIRRGTDVEFGLSVYEPFGISQLEPLTFGAVCVMTDVCGCVGFVRRAAASGGLGDSVIIASYLNVGDLGIEELKGIDIGRRDAVEVDEACRVSAQLLGCLTDDEAVLKARSDRGYELAGNMSWDRVVGDYFLPGLGHATTS